MSFLAVRFLGRRALMLSVTWALVALLEISIRAEDPPVTISADQLQVLQQKAAEVEQLKAKLDAAQRELESLKGAPPPAPVASKGTLWVPPAALRAQTAVKFLHRVDWIAEMFESVVRLEHSHFTDAKGRAPVEFDDDLSPVEIGQP